MIKNIQTSLAERELMTRALNFSITFMEPTEATDETDLKMLKEHMQVLIKKINAEITIPGGLYIDGERQ